MDQEKIISEWYRPSAPASPELPASKKKARKKHPVMKTVMIIVLVLLLIAASAYIFAEENKGEGGAPSGNFSADSPLPEDFRDFFDDYYSNSTVDTGISESALARAETGTGVTLNTQSAEGLPELSLQQVYEKCVDSVVGIATYSEGIEYGWGSGIIMTADGYILTNTHVLSDADEAKVILSSGEEYSALLVGEDTQTDVAVLKIEAEGLQAAEFGMSEELTVGDRVVAIGNPLGDMFTGTMTDGIVSAINRDVNLDGRTRTLIQTNAALNNGNSGGPLINMYGQVVGITNMKMVAAYSGAAIEGIGFAIPGSTMKEIADKLIASGVVTGRPGLGITVGPIPEYVSENYELPEGLYISGVSETCDAYGKVKVGDVLTHVNGSPVRENADVLAIRDAHKVGDELILTIYRDGESLEIGIIIHDVNDVY